MTYSNAEDERRAMVEAMRESVNRMTAHYEPTGLVLHPIDHAKVRIHEMQAPTPEERQAAQMEIADAFGLPYWIAGVDGFRAPWKVRYHPRALFRRGRRRFSDARRWVGRRVPGVEWYGRRGSGAYMDPREPGRGRWWVQIGEHRFGRVPDEDWDW